MSARLGYADIATHYRQLITTGKLLPGDALPTVTEVAERHSVARNTAARAWRQLGDEGFITTRAGAGTTVAERPGVIVTGEARLRRGEQGGKHYAPGETSTAHRAWRQPCTDPDICRMLGVVHGAEIIVRSRVFRMNGTPTVIAVNYVRSHVADVVPEVTWQGKLSTPWRDLYIDRTGRELHRSPEVVISRHATAQELTALEVAAPVGSAVPVIVTLLVQHDEEGPVTVWEDVYAPGTRKEI